MSRLSVRQHCIRIVITNSVFPEKKSFYAPYTRIIGDDSALPTLGRTRQWLTRNQSLGRADGLDFDRLGRQ
jgi:hypothetical protein